MAAPPVRCANRRVEARRVHLRSTAVLPGDASSVEVTAFHGLDAFGRLWRGSANGVSVLDGGYWRRLSTEDGLIWNDTDGEAFWPDADGSVWIGTSGGLAHYRPPGGGLAKPQTADPVITSLEVDQKSRTLRAGFSSLSYKSGATDTVLLPLGPWTLDRYYRADHLLRRPVTGLASPGNPVSGPGWTGFAKSGRSRFPY